MKTETVKVMFPLAPEVRLTVPEVAEVKGVEVVNDITRLEVEMPETVSRQFQRRDKGVKTREVILRVFMEGEERGTGVFHEVDGKDVEYMETIQIPAETPATKDAPGFRKLAEFETVENVARWHVFIVIPKEA